MANFSPPFIIFHSTMSAITLQIPITHSLWQWFLSTVTIFLQITTLSQENMRSGHSLRCLYIWWGVSFREDTGTNTHYIPILHVTTLTVPVCNCIWEIWLIWNLFKEHTFTDTSMFLKLTENWTIWMLYSQVPYDIEVEAGPLTFSKRSQFAPPPIYMACRILLSVK